MEQEGSMTSLTIENEYGSVMVKVHKDDMDVDSVVQELFIPAMNGVGYVMDGNVTFQSKYSPLTEDLGKY
jgi:hypothetical protein